MNEEPDDNFLLPFGKAKIVQEGSNLTIVTWGALVQKSIEAVRNSQQSVEIIDIRTLNPLDMETILLSIEKTNRLIVAHEDHLTAGFGAEIVAQISDVGFEYFLYHLGPWAQAHGPGIPRPGPIVHVDCWAGARALTVIFIVGAIG